MLVTEGELYKIVQNTWTSTLGIQVATSSAAESLAVEPLTVCVKIKITGEWGGEVRLSCSPQLGRLLAACMFHIDVYTIGTNEIFDAFSELVHIVAGNPKALLPQPVGLSLPTPPDPHDAAQTAPSEQIVSRLALMSEGHPFVVALLRGLPASANKQGSIITKTQAPGEKA